jgi:L-fuculose-phosphate aldolase
MPSSSIDIDGMRADIVAACHRLAAASLLIGTAGNVSVRVDGRIAVTATGAVLADLTPEQVTIVDDDGTVLDGSLAPTSETDLHLGIYRRYDPGAVVHTHAPLSTAVACVLDELPCVHYQLLTLGGTVRVAPYHTFGTPELADAVATALDGRLAALMSNHGAVTIGGTLHEAVANALLLEWAAGVYWHASALGKPRVLDEAQQEAAIEAAVARRYGTTHTVGGEQ